MTHKKQKTAVDWLIEKLHKKEIGECYGLSCTQVFDKAKELEKKQILDFYVLGCKNTYGIDEPSPEPNYDRKEGEQYYISRFE